MLPVDIADIETAAQTLAGSIQKTPTVAAPRLSGLLGCDLVLKLECLQYTGSFKDRGAHNKLAGLPESGRRCGVVAASAGNHAQGVAFHANRLRVPATIVMPRLTPFTKVARTEAFGAKIVLHGDNLADSQAHANTLAADRGLTLIHPYDDPLIIAGQGTAGLELLAAVPELDDIVVPIGGGGLISGIAIAAKSIKPSIRITGVEAARYPSMHDALAGIQRAYSGSTIAEGIAVKEPGVLTREIITELVDDILIAEEGMLEAAVYQLLTCSNVLGEGAGAAGLAGIMAHRERFAGRRVATVICGGNIDPRLLSSVLMRGLLQDGRLARLKVEIEDVPGVLARVSATIGDQGGNIVEVHHHRLAYGQPAKRADLEIVVETRDRTHITAIVEQLKAAGFGVAVI